MISGYSRAAEGRGGGVTRRRSDAAAERRGGGEARRQRGAAAERRVLVTARKFTIMPANFGPAAARLDHRNRRAGPAFGEPTLRLRWPSLAVKMVNFLTAINRRGGREARRQRGAAGEGRGGLGRGRRGGAAAVSRRCGGARGRPGAPRERGGSW